MFAEPWSGERLSVFAVVMSSQCADKGVPVVRPQLLLWIVEAVAHARKGLEDVRRRSLFKWLVAGLGAAMGSAVVVPAVVSALSPVRRRAQAWRALGPVRDFEVSRVAKAAVPQPAGEYPVARPPARTVYVWARSAADIIVFSPTCTDLGCAVRYDPGSAFYYCPCHGGIFNTMGEPVAGPPARPLHRYATRIRDGVLEIDITSVPAAM